jgi:hypothetical protein
MIGPGEHTLTWALPIEPHPEPLPTVWLDAVTFDPNASNQSPQIDPITTVGLPLELNVTDRVSYSISISDPDGDLTKLYDWKLPLGISIPQAHEESSYLNGFALRNQRGLHLAQLHATDGAATGSLEFEIRIKGDLPPGFVSYETQRLNENPPLAYRWLGRSLALAEPDVLYAGSGGNHGADQPDPVVFEIHKSPERWEIIGEIEDPSDQELSGFGRKIVATRSWLIIGAPYEDGINTTNSGAVYVYKRGSDGSVSLWQRLSDEPRDYGLFGRNLALSGNDLLVVADQEDLETAANAGSLHFYRLGENGATNLNSPEVGQIENQALGKTLTASSNWLAASSDESVNGYSGTGAAYLYPVNRDIEGVFQGLGDPYRLTAEALEAYPYFAEGLALTENTLFVGAPGWDGANRDNRGRVSYYNLSSGSPQGPRFLYHPEPAPNGSFGRLLATGGGYLAVNAWGDYGDWSGVLYLYRIEDDGIVLAGRLDGAHTVNRDGLGRYATTLTADQLITSTPASQVEPELWYSGSILFYKLNNFTSWKASIEEENPDGDPGDLNSNGIADILDFLQSVSKTSPAIWLERQNDSDFAYFEIAELPAVSGLVYEIQASYDLIDWQTLEPELIRLQPRETWSVPVQRETSPKTFFRINIKEFDQTILNP